jgi:hypothetical protein
MFAGHTPLDKLTNDDLLRIANEYRAMANNRFDCRRSR